MSKYRNVPCELDGEKYRSKKEMARHAQLKLLQRAKQISELQREVPFVLADAVHIGGRKRPALRYFADFVYLDANGARVVEDAKGMRTEGYRIKRHLMATIHQIEILET